MAQEQIGLPRDTFLLLTVRSQNVEHHKGQVSFPGGVRDPSDKDLMHTALRETHEETGLAPEQILVHGALPPVTTASSGFLVTPFVGELRDPEAPWQNEKTLRLNPQEIQQALFLPLDYLARPQTLKRETLTTPQGLRVHLPYLIFQGNKIWGATALMLERFLALLHQKA